MFIPLRKADAVQRLVYGSATAKRPIGPAKSATTPAPSRYYEQWSPDFAKASGGKSLGNVRAMHGKVAAGKIASIAFNDEAKRIEIAAKIVDDDEWRKIEEGVYTGFSQGGAYVKRWPDPENPEFTRYTAKPSEISLVDLPCLPRSQFRNGEGRRRQRNARLRRFGGKTSPPSRARVARLAPAATSTATPRPPNSSAISSPRSNTISTPIPSTTDNLSALLARLKTEVRRRDGSRAPTQKFAAADPRFEKLSNETDAAAQAHHRTERHNSPNWLSASKRAGARASAAAADAGLRAGVQIGRSTASTISRPNSRACRLKKPRSSSSRRRRPSRSASAELPLVNAFSHANRFARCS